MENSRCESWQRKQHVSLCVKVCDVLSRPHVKTGKKWRGTSGEIRIYFIFLPKERREQSVILMVAMIVGG